MRKKRQRFATQKLNFRLQSTLYVEREIAFPYKTFCPIGKRTFILVTRVLFAL